MELRLLIFRERKVDILIRNEVGKGPMYVLSDKLIDITAPNGRNLEEIIVKHMIS